MKSSRFGLRPNQISAIWQGIANPQLSVVLVFLLIGMALLASVIPQERLGSASSQRLLPPDLIHLLRSLGLTDIFRSGWFISVLALIGLNLAIFIAAQIPSVIKLFKKEKGSTTALNFHQLVGGKKQDKYFYTHVQTAMGREEFRELAISLAKRSRAKAQVIRDEGGLKELQIAVEKGRKFPLSHILVCFGVLLCLFGGALGSFMGFEALVSVDEGGRTDFIQLVRGSGRNWPILQKLGVSMPGFYRPGIEIECRGIDQQALRSELVFYKSGKRMSSGEVAAHRPLKVQGLTIHQGDIVDTGQMNVNLNAADSKTGEKLQLRNLRQGSQYEFAGFVLTVHDIQESLEEMGAAVELGYQEHGKDDERFWIFQKFPAYDAARRKKSQFHFSMESLKPRLSSNLSVVRDPGSCWVLIGGLLVIGGIGWAILLQHRRYWYIWVPGQVALIAWSNKPHHFSPYFQEFSKLFTSRISRVDPAMKVLKTEGRKS